MSNASPELRCTFFCSGPAQKDEPEIVICRQEEGKKSSFLLQPDSSKTIIKPAHIKVEYRSDPESNLTSRFFLGGFQLVSNAKHVEVYLTDKDGKESYLMTSKGIMFSKGEIGEEWYKAVSVVPGGPRPIMELHIKLLSLKPKDATIAFLQSLKITARIPESSPASPSKTPVVAAALSVNTQSSHDKEAMSESSSPISKQHAMTPSSGIPNSTIGSPTSISSSSPALTQSDLGAAMSSLSVMAKNAEDRIENAMCERFAKMEGFLDARWEKMEKHVHSLSSVVLSQKSLLAQKVKVMNQQQETLNAQAEQMDSLSQHQKGMSQTISNLAGDISKMRKVLQLVVDRGETAAEISQKHEKRQQEQDDLIKGQMGRIDTLIEQQRELQVKLSTLQLQVSELSVGLKPIIERGEEEDEDEGEQTDAGDSRYNASVEDNNDLMQFADSDDDDEKFPIHTVQEQRIHNDEPTKSLQEHFATSNIATAAKPVKGGSKMNDSTSIAGTSIAATADMTDTEWLDHLEKIEVNLIDDSSVAKSTTKSSPAGQNKFDLLDSPINENQEIEKADTDFFAPVLLEGDEAVPADQSDTGEEPVETIEEKQSFGCLPTFLPMFFKPQKPILLPPSDKQ